jgi:choline monooxygenase
MTFMPEFEQAKNFPSPSDDLPQFPLGTWAGHAFAALDPAAPLEAFLGDMMARMHWLPVEAFRHEPQRDHDYVAKAHWALMWSYLEGFTSRSCMQD